MLSQFWVFGLGTVVEIIRGGNYAYSLAWIGTAKQSRL